MVFDMSLTRIQEPLIYNFSIPHQHFDRFQYILSVYTYTHIYMHIHIIYIYYTHDIYIIESMAFHIHFKKAVGTDELNPATY